MKVNHPVPFRSTWEPVPYHQGVALENAGDTEELWVSIFQPDVALQPFGVLVKWCRFLGSKPCEFSPFGWSPAFQFLCFYLTPWDLGFWVVLRPLTGFEALGLRPQIPVKQVLWKMSALQTIFVLFLWHICQVCTLPVACPSLPYFSHPSLLVNYPANRMPCSTNHHTPLYCQVYSIYESRWHVASSRKASLTQGSIGAPPLPEELSYSLSPWLLLSFNIH